MELLEQAVGVIKEVCSRACEAVNNGIQRDRDFLKLLGFHSAEEIACLIDFAAELKCEEEGRAYRTHCADGKNVALIFEKTSTRTRCSFEVAARDLGMGATYLDPSPARR